MAERPKNYDKWKDLNAKIGDYLRERGYKPNKVDFESGWLGILRVEFGLGKNRAEEWGFTPTELDNIDEMLDNAQVDLDKRTSFYRGDILSGPNPYATPESEVRRRCQERLGNLDNIIHMWDIFAIIGVGPGAQKLAEPQRKPDGRPRFDLFHGLRDSTSSAAISSMEAQRARGGYEAFADTAQQDISPENKPEPARSDAKTGNYVEPQQSRSPGEPRDPSIGKGPVTEPPLSQVFSKKFLGEFGRPWADKADKVGLGEKDLKLLMDLGIKDWALLQRIESRLEKGSEIRQEVQTEMKMLHYLKDNLCGGSVDQTRSWLRGGEGKANAWEAIKLKIEDDLWNEARAFRAQQREKELRDGHFETLEQQREELDQLFTSIDNKVREKTNQILAEIKGTPPENANLPHQPGEITPPSTEKTPPEEANVPGSKGPEVQVPPGGANILPELNPPPRSTEKPPKEMSKPPSIDMDLERPSIFPIIFPQNEPGSETFPMKEPSSIPPPSESPPTGDSDKQPQSVAPGNETFPLKEPQSTSPIGETSTSQFGRTDTLPQSVAPGGEIFPTKEPQGVPSTIETPTFTLPQLPTESKSQNLPSENLSPPIESGRGGFAEFAGARVEGYSSTEDRGQRGGEAGSKPPGGRGGSGEETKSQGGTDSRGNAASGGSEEGGESGIPAGYRPPEGRDGSGGLPQRENKEAEAKARTPEIKGGGTSVEAGAGKGEKRGIKG